MGGDNVEQAAAEIEVLVEKWSELKPSGKSKMKLVIDNKIQTLSENEHVSKTLLGQSEDHVLQCLMELGKALAKHGFISNALDQAIENEINNIMAKGSVPTGSKEKSSYLEKQPRGKDQRSVDHKRKQEKGRFPITFIFMTDQGILSAADDKTMFSLVFKADSREYHVVNANMGPCLHNGLPFVIDPDDICHLYYPADYTRIFWWTNLVHGKGAHNQGYLEDEEEKYEGFLDMSTAENAKAFVGHLVDVSRCHERVSELTPYVPIPEHPKRHNIYLMPR